MKPFRMDLSQFKKVGSGKGFSQFKHPAGHMIHLAHGGLTPSQKRDLEEMPHYADGTDEEPVSSPAVETAPQSSQMPPTQDTEQGILSDIQKNQAQSTQNNDGELKSQSSPDMFGARDYQQGLGFQLAGQQAEANAIGRQGQIQAGAARNFQQNMQSEQDKFNQNYQALDNETNQAVRDARNQHIDPSKYLNDMSAPAKVSTAIGLILGGMGGAITGQGNPALQFLQSQIQNDVNAQFQNMSQKNNIMHSYFQQMGNMRDAHAMTQSFYSKMYASELERAAAQTQDPLAKARLLQTSGQLIQQSAIPLSQMAFRQQMLSGQGGGGTIPPEMKIAALANDPKEAEAAQKELQAVRNHAVQRDAIVNAFDKINSENTLLGRTTRLGFKPPSMAVYQSTMMPYLKDAEGRINESELNRTDNLMPSMGDKASTVAEKRAGLLQFLNEKAPVSVHLQKYGINPNSFGANSASGMKILRELPAKAGR